MSRGAVSRMGLILATALLFAACGDSTEQPDGAGETAGGERQIEVQVASYDLAIGAPQRVMAGLITPDQELIAYGEVEMEFFFLGERPEGETTVGEGFSETGKFLPVEVPGGSLPEGPVAVPASQGRGVYATTAEFDKPGYWLLQVTAEPPDGTTFVGQTPFEVLAEHRIPAPGDKALRTDNLTIDSKDAPAAAIDSRGQTRAGIPDPELHSTTIADALARGRPALVVFSTPVYCISRFCGPITDMVSKLAQDYADVAEFIHIEVWRNYENGVINKAAADWLYVDENLTEPWVFFIDANGRIIARWDNIATPDEIEPYLDAL